MNENLTNCADCGSEVSRRATSCPKCGAPIGSSPAKQAIHQPQMNIAHRTNKSLNTAGSIVSIIGIIGMLGLISEKKEGYETGLIFAVAVSVLGIIMANSKKIDCKNCGYKGKAKVESSPNGCLTVFLYCFFLIPGIIYSLAVPTKYCCPKCGAKVI